LLSSPRNEVGVAQLKQITFHYQKKLAAIKMEYGSCKGFIKVRVGPEKQGTGNREQGTVHAPNGQPGSNRPITGDGKLITSIENRTAEG
jgi:hypothetical protein